LAAILIAVFLCGEVAAQQNLFNVPSAEITVEDHYFLQQQLNFTSSTVSNTTFDYGLGHNAEIGANIFLDSTDLYSPKTGTAPNLLLNGQKCFEFSEHYKLGLGTESGMETPIGQGRGHFSDFTYLTNAFNFDRKGKYYFGGYYANQAFGGGNTPVGVTLGFDYPVVSRHFNVVGDFISGNGSISVGVVGVTFYVWHDWQLSLGSQIPAPNSHNEHGVVVEFTNLNFIERHPAAAQYSSTPSRP
jgi:hypothetical protein